MIEFINSEMYICNICNYFSSSNKIPVDPVRVFTDINDWHKCSDFSRGLIEHGDQINIRLYLLAHILDRLRILTQLLCSMEPDKEHKILTIYSYFVSISI